MTTVHTLNAPDFAAVRDAATEYALDTPHAKTTAWPLICELGDWEGTLQAIAENHDDCHGYARSIARAAYGLGIHGDPAAPRWAHGDIPAPVVSLIRAAVYLRCCCTPMAKVGIAPTGRPADMDATGFIDPDMKDAITFSLSSAPLPGEPVAFMVAPADEADTRYLGWLTDPAADLLVRIATAS